jgi:hypothetical protein
MPRNISTRGSQGRDTGAADYRANANFVVNGRGATGAITAMNFVSPASCERAIRGKIVASNVSRPPALSKNLISVAID